MQIVGGANELERAFVYTGTEISRSDALELDDHASEATRKLPSGELLLTFSFQLPRKRSAGRTEAETTDEL